MSVATRSQAGGPARDDRVLSRRVRGDPAFEAFQTFWESLAMTATRSLLGSGALPTGTETACDIGAFEVRVSAAAPIVVPARRESDV